MNPSPWITRFAPLVTRDGTVLDLASGAGRHARWFLERGYRVTAVDRDTSGLHDAAGRQRLEIITADLEDGSPWPLGGRSFDAVIVANYLHRPLFGDICSAVAPGGVLLYETFCRGNERFGRPSSPDFLLEPGELLARVRPDLWVVAYECGEVRMPRPAVIQRICAVRQPDRAPELPDRMD